MTKKITSDFVKHQYENSVDIYSQYEENIGLWESEIYVFEKYLKKNDLILDLGCGSGRTTFPIYKRGYENITGVDLSPNMIKKAINQNSFYGTNIKFEVGDAINLDYQDNTFDIIIFSFTGLFSIPGSNNRLKVLKEISRLLKDNGLFIFTTYDRDKETKYLKIWEKEKEKWKNNTQDKRLYDFGDLILFSKNENKEIYSHFPNKKEVDSLISSANFKIIENFYRSDLFIESDNVKKHSGECWFYVIGKD